VSRYVLIGAGLRWSDRKFAETEREAVGIALMMTNTTSVDISAYGLHFAIPPVEPAHVHRCVPTTN